MKTKNVPLKETLFLFSFFLLLFSLASCSKDDDEETTAEKSLPPITQTGANTFGCLVNGKLFYPRDGSGFANAVTLRGNTPNPNYFLELDVNNFQDGKPVNNFLMHLHNINLTGVGEYVWKQTNFMNSIDGLPQHYLYIRAFDYSSNSYKFYGSYENSGKTIISNLHNNFQFIHRTG